MRRAFERIRQQLTATIRLPRRTVLLLLTLLVLAACAPARLREDPTLSAAQAARERALAAAPEWSLTARIAVSNGEDGGNGELEWRQRGDQYDFTVHAPVTGKTWRLHGDATQAVLEGVEAEPITGHDPAELLRTRLGWVVPLQALTAWVRAARAPGSAAVVTYNDQQLPAILQQAGWSVEFKDYFIDQSPPLPRKVFASRPPYRVRMVIERWSSGG